jgi:hypothetical protein
MSASNILAAPDMLLRVIRNAAAADQQESRTSDTRHLYTALPAFREPRWVLPVKGPALARGLDIYAPYARRAKLWKWLVSFCLRHGIPMPGNRCVALDGYLDPLDRLVLEILGERDPQYAISIGTGAYAKLTAQVMRRSGEILGFIKLPLTEPAAVRVHNEADVLRTLSDAPRLSPFVPALLYAGEHEGVFLLFQTKSPGRKGPQRMGAAHTEFLQRLADIQPSQQKNGAAVAADVRVCAQANFRIDEDRAVTAALNAADRLLDGESVACGLTHGDFAPWNTKIHNGKLLVFDWESASSGWPTAWDEFHFRVQTACLIEGPADGLPLTAAAPPLEAGLFLLYLVHSAIELLREGVPPAHRAIRQRKLWMEQLSKRREHGSHTPARKAAL